MEPVSFDAATNTIFLVPAFFKARQVAAFVSLQIGIKKDARIKEGTKLATIFWDDGNETSIKSPVQGTVLRTNRQISHTTLHRSPAQWLLELK